MLNVNIVEPIEASFSGANSSRIAPSGISQSIGRQMVRRSLDMAYYAVTLVAVNEIGVENFKPSLITRFSQ